MFKGYSSKSKAKRGLESFINANIAPDTRALLEIGEEGIAELVFQGEEDKWGFDSEKVHAYVKEATKQAEDTFNSAGIGTELQPLATEDGDGVQTDEDGVVTPAPAPNMFANMSTTLGNVAAAAPSAPTNTRPAPRRDYKIEKNRPEQNGIKRPGEGGLCRAVWDFLDTTRAATNEIPVAKLVRAHAETQGWNMNNAMIEFYQWRKFNGIIGRAKKAA